MTAQLTASGQKERLRMLVERAVEEALKESALDKDGFQKLIENDDGFQADIVACIKKHSVSKQFINEEKESKRVYPGEYRVKGIAEQIRIVCKIFPEIGCVDEKVVAQSLPNGAEGWFAIPYWRKIAGTYEEAVEKVLELIKQQRNGKFYNWREGRLGKQYLSRYDDTEKKLQSLANQQKGYDILVFPVQFGFLHRGRSVRRAREVFRTNEFGLGAFEVGCMLLTHPERLLSYEDLWIDCAGDVYSLDADTDFSDAPYFRFVDGEVRFDTYWLDLAHSNYGSASGFLPFAIEDTTASPQ